MAITTESQSIEEPPVSSSGAVAGPDCFDREAKFAPSELIEGQAEYKLLIPLAGIDPRRAYVLAKPQSVCIEYRSKGTISHETSVPPLLEAIECRVSREIVLPAEIDTRSTTVQVCGDSLFITARKAQGHKRNSSSELVQFDTRGSLGCV